jgi:hypothetical protein
MDLTGDILEMKYVSGGEPLHLDHLTLNAHKPSQRHHKQKFFFSQIVYIIAYSDASNLY